MQYPLVLVAAFATAAIAAPAACPPASTQGKEDVAKEVGKLAKEACPPSQRININGLGYILPQDACKPLADKCLQSSITEPAELKKCITNARASEIQSLENPAQSTKKPAKEVGKLAEKACPPEQIITTNGLGYILPQDACKPLADKCLQSGITEPAELKKCITDARASEIQSLENPAQSTEKPAKEVGKLAEKACPPEQIITTNGLGYILPQDACKPLADKCLQSGITEPAELKKCITDARASELQSFKGVEKLAKEACPPSQRININGLGYELPQDACKPLADKCLQSGIIEPAELKKCITNARASELEILKTPAQSTEKPAKAV